MDIASQPSSRPQGPPAPRRGRDPRDPAGPPLRRYDRVSSTQDVAAAIVDAGDALPCAVLAAEQTAGRGRLGRSFASPAGGAFALTYAHPTTLPLEQRSWLPLAAGLAAIDALRSVLDDLRRSRGHGVDGDAAGLGLKWPNDIHTADGRKLGGILVEARGEDAVLIGLGINLLGPIRERGPDGTDGPVVERATWLHGPGGVLAGASGPGDGQVPPTIAPDAVDALRDALGIALVDRLQAELAGCEARTAGSRGPGRADGGANDLRERYTMTCLTVGRSVRVDPLGRPGAAGAVRGIARGVDERGRLLVESAAGAVAAVDVGDVRHLRPDVSGRRAGATSSSTTTTIQEDTEE